MYTASFTHDSYGLRVRGIIYNYNSITLRYTSLAKLLDSVKWIFKYVCTTFSIYNPRTFALLAKRSLYETQYLQFRYNNNNNHIYPQVEYFYFLNFSSTKNQQFTMMKTEKEMLQLIRIKVNTIYTPCCDNCDDTIIMAAWVRTRA